jgi:hypothetical protein
MLTIKGAYEIMKTTIGGDVATPRLVNCEAHQGGLPQKSGLGNARSPASALLRTLQLNGEVEDDIDGTIRPASTAQLSYLLVAYLLLATLSLHQSSQS